MTILQQEEAKNFFKQNDDVSMYKFFQVRFFKIKDKWKFLFIFLRNGVLFSYQISIWSCHLYINFCFFQQGTMLDVINSTNKKTMAEIALMSDSNEVKIWQYQIDFFSTYTELIVWNPNLCQFGHLIRICDKGCIYSKFYLYFYKWKIFQNSLHPKSRVFFPSISTKSQK